MNSTNVPMGNLDSQIDQIIAPLMKDAKTQLPKADGMEDVTAMLEGVDQVK